MTDRADILGCPIDRLGMAETLAAIERAIAAGRYTQHMAINAAKLVAMQDDPKLCEIIDGCGLVNADGQSVVWASRLLGDPLPERVAGIDLMDALLDLAETPRLSRLLSRRSRRGARACRGATAGEVPRTAGGGRAGRLFHR